MDKFLVALLALPNITPTRLRKLLANKTAEMTWKSDFLASGVEADWASLAQKAREKISPEKEVEKLEQIRARVIWEGDAEFPEQLKNIPSNPAWLYVRGNFKAVQNNLLTVVGPRKISHYGKQVTETFVNEIAKNGIGIVSGMALGVDGVAHKAALEVEGYTIAVLGTGIDNFYPPFNKSLGQEILEKGGAIISEYGCNSPVAPQNFPMRNRIVSGLSRGSLIIEASEKSGSLITANLALEQGREVYAVPGDVFSATSVGTNNLIKNGEAQCVLTPQEIVRDYTEIIQTDLFAEEGKRTPTDETEKAVFAHIGRTPKHIDEIIKSCDLPQNLVSSSLMLLEMKGYIVDVGGQRYSIK